MGFTSPCGAGGEVILSLGDRNIWAHQVLAACCSPDPAEGLNLSAACPAPKTSAQTQTRGLCPRPCPSSGALFGEPSLVAQTKAACREPGWVHQGGGAALFSSSAAESSRG